MIRLKSCTVSRKRGERGQSRAVQLKSILNKDLVKVDLFGLRPCRFGGLVDCYHETDHMVVRQIDHHNCDFDGTDALKILRKIKQ